MVVSLQGECKPPQVYPERSRFREGLRNSIDGNSSLAKVLVQTVLYALRYFAAGFSLLPCKLVAVPRGGEAIPHTREAADND